VSWVYFTLSLNNLGDLTENYTAKGYGSGFFIEQLLLVNAEEQTCC